MKTLMHLMPFSVMLITDIYLFLFLLSKRIWGKNQIFTQRAAHWLQQYHIHSALIVGYLPHMDAVIQVIHSVTFTNNICFVFSLLFGKVIIQWFFFCYQGLIFNIYHISGTLTPAWYCYWVAAVFTATVGKIIPRHSWLWWKWAK